VAERIVYRTAMAVGHHDEMVGLRGDGSGEHLAVVAAQIAAAFRRDGHCFFGRRSPHHGRDARGKHQKSTARKFLDGATQPIGEELLAQRLGHWTATRVAGADKRDQARRLPSNHVLANHPGALHAPALTVHAHDGRRAAILPEPVVDHQRDAVTEHMDHFLRRRRGLSCKSGPDEHHQPGRLARVRGPPRGQAHAAVWCLRDRRAPGRHRAVGWRRRVRPRRRTRA
jgi:hypothetical protein